MCPSRAAFSRSIFAVATLSAALAAPALAQSFSFGLNLYPAPEGMTQDQSIGVPLSKDGSVVGATFYPSSNIAGPRYGARITPSGMEVFPDPSRAYDISDGGGYTVDFLARRSASGVVDQVLPSNTPFSYDFKPQISGDGSIVAGSTPLFSSGTVVGSRAYRWTEQGGLQTLPVYRAGATFTSVAGMSQDGSTIVGDGRIEFFSSGQGWKWTAGTGYTILPSLPNAVTAFTRATGVNVDGSIVVGDGSAPVANRFWGMIWRGEQVTGLPPLPAYRSATAYDLSDDGTVITGVNDSPVDSSTGVPLSISTIWTESTGWVPALDYFRMQGIEIPLYLSAAGPANISGDGSTFSMQMYDTRTSEYYISVIAIPSPGVVPLIGLAFIVSGRARARPIL